MANTAGLLSRDDHSDNFSKPSSALLITLLCLLITILILTGALWFIRRRKLQARRAQELPFYTEKRSSISSLPSSHRRILTRPSESAHVLHEKQALMKETPNPPDSPIPEIRITLPEEFDAAGKRQSGRVVVVRVGENGEGLEPIEDNLPAYQEKDGVRFQSLDLDRIGGLVEKEHGPLPKM